MDKIVLLEELPGIIGRLKQRGKSIVQCHGVFDLLHPGHTLHFAEAKSNSDVLVVTITSDRYVNRGPGKPIFNHHIRAKELASREVVDFVAICDFPTGVESIRLIKPDIYAKGPDYKDRETDLTGKISKEESAVIDIGGTLLITEGETYSSSNLLSEYFDIHPPETKLFLDRFKQMYSAGGIIDKLRALRDLKVIIIGDTIIDEYVYCDVLGASPKDNILTANYRSEESFPGGVLAVANHIAGFCNKVHLVTLVNRGVVSPELALGDSIGTKLFFSDEPTVVKRRFIEPDSFRKLFSIDNIPTTSIDLELEGEIEDYLIEVIRDYNLVIVTDFGHGFLTDRLINIICNESKYLAVNTQTNSANRGFNPLTKYHNVHYASLDELEVRLTCLDSFSKLEEITKSMWYKMLGCKLVSVTRGKHGSLLFTKNESIEIPSLSQVVVDAVGAGDAYLAITSLLAARGCEPEVIGFIGNAVGALQVKWAGNRESINPTKLYKFITTLLK